MGISELNEIVMREALLYEKTDEGVAVCALCSHRCRIKPGARGICGVRENREGTLFSLVYNRPVSTNIEPIEKKPFYHFQPNSRSYSVGTVGCNFRCQWCQNFEIAQWPQLQKTYTGKEPPTGKLSPPGQVFTPEDLVADALQSGCQNISYTYNEPTIFFEYAYEIASLARERGLANVFVTNGFMTPEMLDRFYPFLDAANVDMKGFRERTYRRYSGARLEPVLENLKKLKEQEVWVEVTTLVVPGINDDPSEAFEMAGFIVEELGADTPWHLSRFYPAYKMQDTPPTPLETLRTFRKIGHEAGIQYIYLGNVAEGSDTFCHECGELLINRSGYSGSSSRITADGTCSGCGVRIPGVSLIPG